MYKEFYGLKEKPFQITPDPRFLYLSENHREALAHLTYAVRERKGFTVITGEVGTGKTTLIQTLLGRLDGNTKTAYLFNPRLNPGDFLHYICEDLGLKDHKKSKGEYLAQLHDFLIGCYSRNENVVLIIDEAQGLDPRLLEEVRLLTNLETPKSKLLQVILMGQPELDSILNTPQCRQLKQRINLRYQIQSLKKEETRKYIEQRLRTAGAIYPRYFSPKAIKQIYKYSKGIPRLINIICDNALLIGYATGQRVIGPSVISEVVRDLERSSLRAKRKKFVQILVAVFIFICLGLLLLWRGDELMSNAMSFFKEAMNQAKEFYGKIPKEGKFLKDLFKEILRIFS